MDQTTPPFHTPPPPPLIPALPARRKRSVWPWVLVAVAGGLLVLLVIFLGAYGLHGLSGLQMGGVGVRQAKPPLQEVVVDYHFSRNKIAVIDVAGIITSQAWDGTGRNMVDLIEDQFKLAANDDAVKAVVLKVDSPGGEVMASDDISRAITRFQEKTDKPVVASMGSLAASGGYYVSAPCRWIVANELTLTGSIGVIMQSFNYRGLLDKVGLYPHVFKSGRFKDMLSGAKKPTEVDPEETRMIQDMVDETFNKFKSVVSEGRRRAAKENQGDGRALVENWTDYADGRVLTGKQAHEFGFVDELGTFDTAVKRAKLLAGLSADAPASVIRYQLIFDLSSLFSLFGEAKAKSIKLDLGMDLPKLEAGRPYFLSPTFIH